MTKYTEDITNKVKDYLKLFDFEFFENYIICRKQEENVLKEVFGINDNLYEFFDVDYIIVNEDVSDGSSYFVYHYDYLTPLGCVFKDTRNKMIRRGFSKDFNKDSIWYTEIERTNIPKSHYNIKEFMNNIIKDINHFEI